MFNRSLSRQVFLSNAAVLLADRNGPSWRWSPLLTENRPALSAQPAATSKILTVEGDDLFRFVAGNVGVLNLTEAGR